MRTKNHAFRAFVCSVIAFLALAFVVCSTSCVYAKGAQRTPSRDGSGDSGYSRDSGSDSQQSNRSDERSNSDRGSRVESQPQPSPEPRQEYRPEPRPEPRRDTTPTPPPTVQREEPRRDVPAPERVRDERPSAPPSSYRQTPSQERRSEPSTEAPPSTPQVSDRSNDGPSVSAPQRVKGHESTPSSPGYRNDSRNDAKPDTGTQYRQDSQPQTHTSDRSVMPDSRRDGSTTAPQTDRSISAESPVVRDTRSSDARRDGPRIPNLTGVYRKEYADLGQIWRQRTETRRQDPRSRYHDDYRDDHRDGTNVFVNVNIFPNAYYPHYAYEYDPWYSYPSVYCYYSGLFPPYINYQRVVYIQRPVVVYRYVDIPMTIIYRDDPVYYRDSDNSDDYYLNSYRYRYLYDTLRHIERAWEQSDPDMLLDHVRKNSKLDIFLKDDYAYTIDWQDFAEMTEDAMSHIRTVDFEVYKIRQREYGTVEVFAKHTYYDVDGYDPYAPDRDPVLSYDYSSAKRNTVYLQYTLEKNGNNWYIVEVGTSPNRAR